MERYNHKVVEKKWELLSLTQEEVQLEDVFRNLTS